MSIWNAGVAPASTDDPLAARRLLMRDGACVLEHGATDDRACVDGVREVLGKRLRAYRLPVAIGTNPQPHDPVFFDHATRTANSDSRNQSHLHVDGYMAFGAEYPDFVFLLCHQTARVGGESFAVDAYRLIAAIERRENLHDLARFLWRTPIDQSTPTGLPHVRPTAQLTPGGRLSVLRHDSQRVGGNPDPRSQTLLERWHDITEEAAAEAPRFLLRPGELLCLDNYRILHGREAYEGVVLFGLVGCGATGATPAGRQRPLVRGSSATVLCRISCVEIHVSG